MFVSQRAFYVANFTYTGQKLPREYPRYSSFPCNHPQNYHPIYQLSEWVLNTSQLCMYNTMLRGYKNLRRMMYPQDGFISGVFSHFYSIGNHGNS